MKNLLRLSIILTVSTFFSFQKQEVLPISNDNETYFLMLGDLEDGVYSLDKLVSQEGIKLKSTASENFSHPVIKCSILIISKNELRSPRLIVYSQKSSNSTFKMSSIKENLYAGDKVIISEVFVLNAENKEENIDVDMIIEVE